MALTGENLKHMKCLLRAVDDSLTHGKHSGGNDGNSPNDGGNNSGSSSVEFRPADYPGILNTDLTTLSSTQQLAFTIVISTLCFLSLCGNIGTLCVNFQRKMKPFFRACIISLALSDLVNTAFLTVAYLSQFTAEYVQIWRLGFVMCNLVPFATTGAILASSMTLVGIALDRYFAVMKAFVHYWNPGTLFSIICTTAIWAISIGIASPLFWIYHLFSVYILRLAHIDSNGSTALDMTTTDWQGEASKEDLSYTLVEPLELVQMCVSDQKDVALYYVIVFGIIFAPSIVAFVWLNAVIAKKIWIRRHPRTQQLSNNVQPKRKYLRRKADCNNFKLRELTATTGYADAAAVPSNLTTSTGGTTLKMPSTRVGCSVDPVASASSFMKTNITITTTASNSTPITTTTTDNTREARHIRMVVVIVLLIAVFIFLRLPAWIFLVMRMYGTYSKQHDWIIYFALGTLNLASCALNPLFYSFLPEAVQYISSCRKSLCVGYCGLRKHCEKRVKKRSTQKMGNENSTENGCCGNLGILNICQRSAPEGLACNTKSEGPTPIMKPRPLSFEMDEGVDCSDASYEDEDEKVNRNIYTVFSRELVSSSETATASQNSCE